MRTHLEKELKTDRVASLDLYVFTCYDDGATDGFRAVLSSVCVRRVILSPPCEAEKDEFDALTALLDRVAVPYTALQEERSVLGYEISLTKSEPYEDAPTAPIKLDLTAGGDRLLYLGENVPQPTAIPYGVTLLFLGAHGETPYLSFALDLPVSVRTVFTGSEFYKTCTFAGGASDLRLFCRKRLVPDGFLP